MPPSVHSTSCRVFIQPPSRQARAFLPEELARSLLAIETEKDLRASCGSFTLTFTPEVDVEGRRWDQRIPRRSLVFITLERPDATHLATEEPTVMVGLTDDHSVQEDYSAARPQRVVRIHGREVSCVLVDAMLWYHSMLAHDPATGTLAVTSLLGEQQLALTQNPHLARVYEDPRVILNRILDYYLYVGSSALEGPPGVQVPVQAPVINLDFPLPLSRLLDKNQAAWTTFEPVRFPIPQHPANAGSLWNYLHIYIDRAFQEFFTRIEGGRSVIHFRGKPFKHALHDVRGGSRFKTTAEEPTLRTLQLDPADLLAQQTHVQTSEVYNVFSVVPRGMSDIRIDPHFKQRIMPQIIIDHRHPSFVGRYGLRILEVETPYLSPLVEEAGPTASPGAQSLRAPSPHAANYAHLANQLAYEEGIPAPLLPWFVALIKNESNFNPNAVGKVLRSGNRAEGIAQWVAPYPAGVGLTNPFDPANALQAAAKYWQQMRAMPWIGDDPRLLVAGYNAGPFAVQAAGGIPPFAETQRLVRAVEADAPQYAGLAGVTPAQASPTTAPAGGGNVIAMAQRWAAILRCWYDMGGELFSGQLTVRGHPAWNIGHRLVGRDARGTWEAYIEGIRHTYEMRTGQYLTHLRITRGWYLEAPIIQQLYAEGQTNVTGTAGGPPTLDPVTGLPVQGTERFGPETPLIGIRPRQETP